MFLVEVKKPGAKDSELEGDRRRFPCMQKVMLDRMLAAGVVSPTVVAFLIRGKLSFFHVFDKCYNNHAINID